jgi:hypothetical protein
LQDLHEAPQKQWKPKEEDTQGRVNSHKWSKTFVVE